MIINHNIPALISNNALRRANASINKSSARLATGYKINEAKDDAAGLAISTKMAVQIKGNNMAQRNVEDASALLATAESGLGEVDNMVQRLRELAVESANGIYCTSDRAKIQAEADQLIEEINGVSEKIQFNTQGLLDGNKTFIFQIGQNKGLNMSFKFDSVSVMYLGNKGKSGESSYLTYSANYDETGEAGRDYSEAVTVRSLASLSTKYSNYYSSGITNSYENLEYEMENFNAFADNYEKIIASGVDPQSSEAAKAYIKVKDTYDRITDISEKLTEISNETANGTSISRENAVDISSNVTNAVSSISNFLNSMTERLTALHENHTDRTKETTEKNLSELGTLLKDNFIPASERYFASIKSGEGAFSSQEGAGTAITLCDSVLSDISKMRSLAGAAMNRLEYTLSSLETSDINLQDALSRIRDTDLAKEMSEYSKYDVIIQAGISTLAQANQRPDQILSLIQ